MWANLLGNDFKSRKTDVPEGGVREGHGVTQ